MPAELVDIIRFPVKGLSTEKLQRVRLTKGHGLPHDRRFAIARGDIKFDVSNSTWLRKTNFYMLMRNKSLAGLTTKFDENWEYSLSAKIKPKSLTPTSRCPRVAPKWKNSLQSFSVVTLTMGSHEFWKHKITCLAMPASRMGQIAINMYRWSGWNPYRPLKNTRIVRSIPSGFGPIYTWKGSRPGKNFPRLGRIFRMAPCSYVF